MRAVVQRTSQAAVSIDNQTIGSIGAGLLVLVGIETGDTPQAADWIAEKIVKMRLFADPAGAMNRSLTEVGGDLLVVSQFTLQASTRKGNRPSFIAAARPDEAIPLYQVLLARFEALLGKPVASGRFGADMQVSLINDGPVTILLDSNRRE